MKLVRSVTLLASLLSLGNGVALAKGDKSGDIPAALEANEKKVNEAFKNHDEKGFMALIDPNGWSVDPMGVSPSSAAIEMMKQVDIKSYTLTGYKTMMVDKDCYIATYTWNGDATFKGQPYPAGPWYCSTVWTKRGKEWIAVFHQESLSMPPAQAGGAH